MPYRSVPVARPLVQKTATLKRVHARMMEWLALKTATFRPSGSDAESCKMAGTASSQYYQVAVDRTSPLCG